MSNLIIPTQKVWTRQPPQITQVDRGKAKDLGVEYLAIANETGALRDLVGGSTLTNPGGGSVGDQGRVWTFNGAQAANKAFSIDTANIGQYLVCARIKATASQAGSPGGAFGIFASGSQSGYGVAFNSSNQVGGGFLSNAGAGMTCYSAGVLNKFYDVFVNLGASATLKAWINGVPAATNQGGAVSNFIYSQNEIAVGAQHRSSGFLRQFTGHIEWVALLKLDAAAYTDPFISQLYADRFPYNLLSAEDEFSFASILASGSSTNLTIAEALHAHSADSLLLSWQDLLTVADSTHAHTVDNPTLSTQWLLAVQEALHAHAADNIGLSATGSTSLSVQDSTHAHLADALTLVTTWLLSVADSTHGHTADNLTLDTSNAITLTVQESLHAQIADAIGLTLSSWLSIAEVLHAHLAESPFLSIDGAVMAARVLIQSIVTQRAALSSSPIRRAVYSGRIRNFDA